MIKKKILFIITFIMVFGCNPKNKKNNTIIGFVNGLQKGNLYLQKINDREFITLDSVSVKGEKEFELSCNLEEPEILFLSLSKNSKSEKIPFFGYDGITKINTSVDRFNFDAEIIGGPQQNLLETYNKNIKKFKNKELELLETFLNAQRLNNQNKMDRASDMRDKNLKRQYLYTINFAINNNKSEIAPYVALMDISDAKFKYLDTIYNNLSQNIKASKYGTFLKEYLEEIK